LMPLSVDVAGDLILRARSSQHSVTSHLHVGTPEDEISATPGSLSIDPVAGELYLKRSGSAATGWQSLASSGEAPTPVEVIDVRKDIESEDYYYYGVYRSDDSWTVYRYSHGDLVREVSHGEA